MQTPNLVTRNYLAQKPVSQPLHRSKACKQMDTHVPNHTAGAIGDDARERHSKACEQEEGELHLVVLDDLGDEVARVCQVGADWHTHPQDQNVGILLQQALHQGLHLSHRFLVRQGVSCATLLTVTQT